MDKTTLELSGFDSSRFKPHSIRSASASAAAVAKVLVDTILRTAGWSGHCSFAKLLQATNSTMQHGELARVLLDSTRQL